MHRHVMLWPMRCAWALPCWAAPRVIVRPPLMQSHWKQALQQRLDRL